MDINKDLEYVKRIKGTYDMDSFEFYDALDRVLEFAETINTRNQWVSVDSDFDRDDYEDIVYGAYRLHKHGGKWITDQDPSVFKELKLYYHILPTPPGGYE